MIAIIKSLFTKPKTRKLNINEALDRSLKYGYHSVVWHIEEVTIMIIEH